MPTISAEFSIPNQDGVEHALTCPCCGDSWLHHTKVRANRAAVVVDMRCETCGGGIALTLTQHKGETIIGWQVQPC